MARVEDALRVEIVHVPSHSRHRQKLVTVMTFASVSMILPLQNGQFVGRVTGSANFVSRMLVFPFLNASNAEGMRGLREQEPERQPQRHTAGNDGSGRDRALPDFPVVFHSAGAPGRPSLIGGAEDGAVGNGNLGLHDAC